MHGPMNVKKEGQIYVRVVNISTSMKTLLLKLSLWRQCSWLSISKQLKWCERFSNTVGVHILACLRFIMVEEIIAAGQWQSRWSCDGASVSDRTVGRQ